MTDVDLENRVATFQRCIEDRDVAVADAVLHPGYALELVHPERAVMPRDRWLKVLADYAVHDYVVHEQIIDVDPTGTSAAVLHRATQRATVLGEDRSGTFVISDIWLRNDRGWRVWRRHSTPLAAGRMPGTGDSA